MNSICRKVDRECEVCTACGKTLTLRVLAYKHAKTCKAYDDRLAKRRAQAHEHYHRTLKRMRGEDDDTMTNTTASTTDSENSDNSTGGTSQESKRTLFAENANGEQFGATSLHKNHEKTSETQSESTAPHKIDEYTSAATFGSTRPPKIDEKTPQATNEGQKTQEITPGITLQSKKTLRVTPGATIATSIDNKITSMFHHMPQFR